MNSSVRTLSPLIAVHLALLVSACGPSPTPIVPPTSLPTASSRPIPSADPSIRPSFLPVVNPTVKPTSNPSAAASASVTLPNGSQLIISLGNRFLTKAGESMQVQIRLLDPSGKELPLNSLKFIYSSSRPQDISIDANGLILARVDEGFSEISVHIEGSDLVARQLVSVNSAESYSGGGGGGSQASANPLENIAVNVDFEGLDIGEIGVNSETSNNQRLPVIAMDADGDFVVAWQNYSSGSSDIFAQRFYRSGEAIGSEFLLNSNTSGQQRNIAIAMDNDGDFVVTWHGPGANEDEYGIFAQRYNCGGLAQGSEFKVNTYTTGFQSEPSVAMDADGDFVVSWTSNQDGDTSGIYAQRFNSLGSALGSEFLVNTWTTDQQISPTIAMDADGDFVVTWRSFFQDGDTAGDGNIYAQRFDNIGSMLGSEFKVNTYTTDVQSNQDVAMSANGNFVIIWQSRHQDGDFSGVYGQHYHSSGLPQGTEFRVNTYTTSSQSNPAVAMDADGDFVVTWQSYYQEDPSDSTLDEYGVYAQRYSSAGQLLGSEFLVNKQTLDDQFVADVALDADGDFVVVWEGSAQDGDGEGIFARLFNQLGQAQ